MVLSNVPSPLPKTCMIEPQLDKLEPGYGSPPPLSPEGILESRAKESKTKQKQKQSIAKHSKA